MTRDTKHVITICALSIIIPVGLFFASITKTGERRLGVLETIHGIPFPKNNESILILEEMAHADLFLEEPVLAKQAKILITFDPGNAQRIDLGIRENEFWLSYIKYPVYQKGVDEPGVQTKEIILPLTSALQDTDRSVDLMFFTDTASKNPEWRIQVFHASLEFIMPSIAEAKAYIKSILIRERPL